jgi:hypothetical protein
MGEARGGLSFQRNSLKVLNQNYILTSDEIIPKVDHQEPIVIQPPALHSRKRGFRNHGYKAHLGSLTSTKRR